MDNSTTRSRLAEETLSWIIPCLRLITRSRKPVATRHKASAKQPGRRRRLACTRPWTLSMFHRIAQTLRESLSRFSISHSSRSRTELTNVHSHHVPWSYSMDDDNPCRCLHSVRPPSPIMEKPTVFPLPVSIIVDTARVRREPWPVAERETHHQAEGG